MNNLLSSPGKTFVCFANSRKGGGHCIAGKEWLDGKPGKWIRPVSARPAHEISGAECRFANFGRPELLDVLDVKFEKHLPVAHQHENYLIAPTVKWSRTGCIAWKDVHLWADNPMFLWTPGDNSRTGINNRVKDEEKDGESIYLIPIKSLTLLVGKGASGDPKKRKVKGEFFHYGIKYKMDVTDPFIEGEYLDKGDGRYVINDTFCSVSLAGEKYNDGYYYKFIAAVLYEDRFK